MRGVRRTKLFRAQTAPAVAVALQCAPPVDAEIFEESVDVDSVFFEQVFEEPMADIADGVVVAWAR